MEMRFPLITLAVGLVALTFGCGHPIHDQFKSGGQYHRDVAGGKPVHQSRILVLPPPPQQFETAAKSSFDEELRSELSASNASHEFAVRRRLYREFVEEGRRNLSARSRAVLLDLPDEMWGRYDALSKRFVQMPLDASLFPVLNAGELERLGAPEADYVLSFTDAGLSIISTWEHREIANRTSSRSSAASHAYVLWDPRRGRSVAWGFARGEHGAYEIDADVLRKLAARLAKATLQDAPFVADSGS